MYTEENVENADKPNEEIKLFYNLKTERWTLNFLLLLFLTSFSHFFLCELSFYYLKLGFSIQVNLLSDRSSVTIIYFLILTDNSV